jgi:Tfp pilus assembly protein PilX/cytoskeletal protein CcmA (bactofilin family)
MLILRNSGARERGSAFILAMVALVVLLFVGVSYTAKTMNALHAASGQRGYTMALMLAESGVDRAVIELYENYNNVNETLAGAGQYSANVALPQGAVAYTVSGPYEGIGDTVLIDSTGTTNQGKTSKVRVVAKYIPDVSATFRGAIFSDNPLTLSGAGGVYPDVSGAGGDIYANGDITFDGTSFNMSSDGYIYTTGTTSWVPDEVPATHVYERIPPFPMPVIDLDYYRTHATTYYSSSQSWTGGFSLDGITFVDGNVKLSGNYTGKGIIVASGTITIVGNVLSGDLSQDALALLSPRAIKINGNPTVEGLLYCHNVASEISLGGNPVIHGAVVADVVTTVGGIEVHYSDVWAGMDLPGTGKTQWVQVSWQQTR